MHNITGSDMDIIAIYFDPAYIAYFVSIISLCVAAYAVYQVSLLADYVETLKKNIKSSNALYEENNKYSSKLKRK
jgi:hypothetical protein